MCVGATAPSPAPPVAFRPPSPACPALPPLPTPPPRQGGDGPPTRCWSGSRFDHSPHRRLPPTRNHGPLTPPAPAHFPSLLTASREQLSPSDSALCLYSSYLPLTPPHPNRLTGPGRRLLGPAGALAGRRAASGPGSAGAAWERAPSWSVPRVGMLRPDTPRTDTREDAPVTALSMPRSAP